MKPPPALLWPTVPATLAAAVGIALSVFLLPGAGVQVGPTPLLPAIAAAAGRVAADLPRTAGEHASKPVENTPSSAQLVATPTEHFVPQRRQAATTAHRAAHHGARTRIVRPASPAPVQVPAVPGAPVTTTTAKGKAHGNHGHALKPTAGAPASHAHGTGKGLGHSRGRHHGPGSGHTTKAPTATPPTPATPPNANGGGKGHKGGKK